MPKASEILLNLRWDSSSGPVREQFFRNAGCESLHLPEEEAKKTPEDETEEHNQVDKNALWLLAKAFRKIGDESEQEKWLLKKLRQQSHFKMPISIPGSNQLREVIADSPCSIPDKICLAILLIQDELQAQAVTTPMVQSVFTALGVKASNLTASMQKMLNPKEQWPLLEHIEIPDSAKTARVKLGYRLTKEGEFTVKNLLTANCRYEI